MRIDNRTKNLIQAKSAVTTVLKKYQVSWPEITRNNALLAWQALAGVWKNKRIPDATAWQRKIRREWDRKLL